MVSNNTVHLFFLTVCVYLRTGRWKWKLAPGRPFKIKTGMRGRPPKLKQMMMMDRIINE